MKIFRFPPSQFCMRLLCFAVLILGFTSPSCGEEKISVAVLPFHEASGKETSQSATLAKSLSSHLSKITFLKIASNEEGEKLASRLKISGKPEYDEITAAKQGKASEFDFLILGIYTESRISCRVLHCASGKIAAEESVGFSSELALIAEPLARVMDAYLGHEDLQQISNDSPEINFDFTAEIRGRAGKIIAHGGDKTRARPRDTILFTLKANRRGRALILSLPEDGRILILFPVKSQSGLLKPGVAVSIPSQEDGFSFTVPESGRVYILALFFTGSDEWPEGALFIGKDIREVKEGCRMIFSRGLTKKAKDTNRKKWETRKLQIEVTR